MRRMKNAGALGALLLSMLIFGTVGIFRRYIPLPSGAVALARGVIGTLFLVVLMAVRRRRPDFSALCRNWLWLLLSGACLGVNWILFFEANLHTTVAAATVCYYMAPILVMVAAPLLLRERITLKKGVCIAVAFVGLVLVSGIFEGASTRLKGNLFGLAAACVYASIVLLNKQIKGVSVLDRTVAQLAVSAVVLLPYVLLTEPVFDTVPTLNTIWCLLLIGVLHTGVAYALYFGAMGFLRAQTVALCSYIDPAVAILCSALFLREQIGLTGYLGAGLVLGAAAVGELGLPWKKKTNTQNAL